MTTAFESFPPFKKYKKTSIKTTIVSRDSKAQLVIGQKFPRAQTSVSKSRANRKNQKKFINLSTHSPHVKGLKTLFCEINS